MSITLADTSYHDNGAGTTFPAFATSVLKGDLIKVDFYAGAFGALAPGVSLADNINTGNYTVIQNQFDGANNRAFLTAYIVANATSGAGNLVITVSGLGGGFFIANASRFTGFLGTPTNSAADSVYTGPTTGTAVASTLNTSKSPELMTSFIRTLNGTTLNAAPSGWTLSNATDASLAPYYGIFPSSGTATNFNGTLNVSDTWYVLQDGFYDFVAGPFGDGTVASNTAVTTGTGGQAMPAISVGQLLHIIVACEATGLSETLTWIGTSGGTFQYIQSITSAGWTFDEWYCEVTTAVAAPVIRANYTGGTPTLAAIAVGISNVVSQTIPFTTGYSNVNHQASPSGANGQISGNTTNSLLNGAAYLMSAFGFSYGLAAAPTAGTGFTQVATMWAGLGAACMTYENEILTGVGAPAQATFTPVAGSASMTMMAAFNIAQPPFAPFRRTQFFVTDTVVQQ